MSGVAVGEGPAGDGDAPVGGFSFNEDGTCINESKESLAGVGDGLTVGEVICSDAGLGCDFSGFVEDSAWAEGALGRCLEMLVGSFFFDSALAGASSNLPCTIIPDTWLETT